MMPRISLSALTLVFRRRAHWLRSAQAAAKIPMYTVYMTIKIAVTKKRRK